MDDRQFERFMAKVEKTDSCWLWTASLTPKGYGQFNLIGRRVPGRRPYAAHRVSYEHFVGAIPDGLQIDHLCRETRCVNPAHLEVVTIRENVRRGLRGVLSTHCAQGHPRTEENTYWHLGIHRQCRVCRREGMRRYRAAKT